MTLVAVLGIRIRNPGSSAFDSWIRDGKKSGSGMNIPDNFLSFERVFGLKIPKFFVADPNQSFF
jgi:hypothetical protein